MDELRISALMCSKVCHDLISPVGALGNGVEVMEEDSDPEMQKHAMALIKASAEQASAKLQFARLAYGASGAAGSEIDLAEAGGVIESLLGGGKIAIHWNAPERGLDKDLVKLLANLAHIGCDCIPRGGDLTVNVLLTPEEGLFKIEAKGVKAKLADEVWQAMSGKTSIEDLDARSIVPHVCGEISRKFGDGVVADKGEEAVTFTCRFRLAA